MRELQTQVLDISFIFVVIVIVVVNVNSIVVVVVIVISLVIVGVVINNNKYGCYPRLSVAALPRGGAGLLGCQGRFLQDPTCWQREDQRPAVQ